MKSINQRDRTGYQRWLKAQRRKEKVYRPLVDKHYFNHQGKLTEVIYIPKVLDIYDNKYAEESLDLFHKLEKHFISDYQVLILDFQSTYTIKAPLMVMLFAILEKLITESQKRIKIRYGKKTHSRSITESLKKSGIVNLCKEAKINNIFTKLYLPIVSSTGGKLREEIVDFIVQKIYKSMPPILEHTYADAIQEAINNVSAHAYLMSAPDTPRKWWLLCELFGDQLYLAIYDTGIGIPQSLEVNPDFSQLNCDDEKTRQELKNVYDAHITWIADEYPTFDDFIRTVRNKQNNAQNLPDEWKIYMAMYGNMTRKTGKDELKHGQGSKSIKALVSCNEQGFLWIFSGFGRMKFTDDKHPPDLSALPKKLSGTLIQWNIKVTP